MQRKVTVKQNVFENTWTDEKGATLRALGVQSHTNGEKDFRIEAVIELTFPAEPPFRKEPVRTVKIISGEGAGTFDETAREIVKLVQMRRAFPSTSPRPYTELSTSFVQDINIGNFKETGKQSVYFFEIANGPVLFRFLIDNEDQLGEVRYFFRQIQEFHQSICQQQSSQAA